MKISKDATNEGYEAKMATALQDLQAEGVGRVAFGDIFLEDLRTYREEKLAQAGMEAVFPIWKRDTAELARQFVAEGFRAVITCVDTNQLDGAFAGRLYDEAFLDDLPAGVDPCGENGDFHSFVFDGPVFREPIPVRTGDIVLRDERFNFCDVLVDS